MKLSTVLLSSAALLVAGAAYAADLPAKKAAPAAAPTGCASFGAGYIAIPGGDTCLKISGSVWYAGDYAQSTNKYGQDGYFRLNTNVKSNSDIVVITTQAAVNMYAGNANSPDGASGAALREAYINFSGVTAGFVDSLSDIGGSFPNQFGTGIGEGRTGAIQYAVNLGATTLSLAEENAVTDANAGVSSRPDILAKLSGSAGALKYNVVGVSHAAVDASTGATGQGYAFLAQASVSSGSVNALLWGGTSYGAQAYTSALGTTTSGYDMYAGTMSKGSNFGGEVNTTVGGVTVALDAGQQSVTTAYTGGASTNTTYYGLFASVPVAKNLNVMPELLVTSTGTTSTNVAYLQIERDF